MQPYFSIRVDCESFGQGTGDLQRHGACRAAKNNPTGCRQQRKYGRRVGNVALSIELRRGAGQVDGVLRRVPDRGRLGKVCTLKEVEIDGTGLNSRSTSPAISQAAAESSFRLPLVPRTRPTV